MYNYNNDHEQLSENLIFYFSRKRLSPEEKKQQPLAGSIFKVKNLGTRGLPSIPYDG